MCGIIGILSRPATRSAPPADELLGGLDAALDTRPDLVVMTEAAGVVDRKLRGVPGIQALIAAPDLVAALTSRLDRLDDFVAAYEEEVDVRSARLTAVEVEAENARLISLKDVLWAIRNDRFRTAREVEVLARQQASPSALAAYLVVQQAFSAIDRMEVRGRDSAGIHLYVWDHGIEVDVLDALIAERTDPLFGSGAVVAIDGGGGRVLSFVYKQAVEIGELGDNTAALRRAVASDDLLRRAVSSPDARVALLGHTRWASVGIISEPNTHPLNSVEVTSTDDDLSTYVVAALNGDVDNHPDLRAKHALRIIPPITTDAKVIPTITSRYLAEGLDPVEAFRRTVSSFDGSVAIGALAAANPATLMVALRGSGQGLYVGLAEDRYVVASEPYGVVEETDRYLRMQGDGNGEIIALSSSNAGELEGLKRWSYDAMELPVGADEVRVAEFTTRDINRGSAPHFLLKEIAEAPASFARTLRGKIFASDDRTLRVHLGEQELPPDIASAIADGTIRRVRIIGQGTAAVAGQGIADILDELTAAQLNIDSVTATDLSGFELQLDMSDTLAIAISQSGTTTDTNRCVDLVRARGGKVIAIVNRRASDLVDKADGVLYTSDGRDVEMSVASTKAFYAQVAAGTLLSSAIADAANLGDPVRRSALLHSLRDIPDAMRATLKSREQIVQIARRVAPMKRYWAVVGNGPNKVAAEEVRIKLSELCYKSVSCDSTEDKKHIDLSSESLILVCAAGIHNSTADDVAKEVAIFRAHKATPIVFATEGETIWDADAVIVVPAVDPTLDFLLSAMAGHLFAYEAALAIDETAHPLHQARELIGELTTTGTTTMLSELQQRIPPIATRFTNELRSRRYDGHLRALTAVRLFDMLQVLQSDQPVEAYQQSSGKVVTPGSLIDDLVGALTAAIDESTRPIDAIKHQAKTVTVGISRSDEEIIGRPLVQAIISVGVGRDVLSYGVLKVLAALDPAIAEVRGFTRYDIQGNHVTIIDRGGISRDLPSRVEGLSELRGTKRRVAAERKVAVIRGRSDGRTVVIVPEVKSGETTGLTLLHVLFHDFLPAEVMSGVLRGYDRRYEQLVDLVVETEGSFDGLRLGQVGVEPLLTNPISLLADHWRISVS